MRWVRHSTRSVGAALSGGALAVWCAAGIRAQEAVADARALLSQGRYVDAEAAAERLYTATLPSAEPGPLADTLDLYVETLVANGRGAQPKTRALADRALDLRKSGPARDRWAVSLRGSGEVLLQSADYAPAVSRAREALSLDEAAGRAPDAADDLDLLARARAELEQFDDALAASNRALEFREREMPRDDVRRARSLEIRGAIRIRRGEYANSNTDLADALRLRQTATPGHADIANTLTLLGEQQRLAGDLSAARQSLQLAVAEARRLLRAEHPLTAAAMRGLAAVLQDFGALAESETMRREAFRIAESAFGADHVLTAIYANDLANTLYLRGEYTGARRLYERARSLYERRLGPSHLGVTTASYNLGLLFYTIGDLDAAEREFRSVAGIWGRTMRRRGDLASRPLSALAATFEARGELAQAEAYYRRALRLRETALGDEHPLVGALLSNLATTVAHTGALRRASALSARSVKIFERSGETGELADALVTDARIFFDRGDYAHSAAELERAASIQSALLGGGHPSVGATQVTFAETEARLGRRDEAFERAMRGDRIVREHSRATLGYLPERQALDYAASRPRGLDLALSLASTPAQRTQVLDALVLGRAVTLDEVASRRRAIRSVAGEDSTALWTALTAARQRLANLVVRGPGRARPAEYAALLDGARREKEDAERALAERSAIFRSELAKATVGLPDVRSALPPGSALLSFIRFRRTELPPATAAGAPRRARVVGSYAAFVTLPDAQAPELVVLGRADAIDQLVVRWRSALAASAAGTAWVGAQRAAGRALRRVIWDPVAPRIAGVGRLFVVPDGSLNEVPLAALPVGASQYLLETGPVIHYVSAERDLVDAARAPDGSGRGLLAIGNPAFSIVPAAAAATNRGAEARPGVTLRSTACPTFQSMRFAALPWTGRETQEIAELYRTSDRGEQIDALTGTDASEPALKRLGPGRRIIHLATHGFFLGDECASSIEGTRAVGGLVSSKPTRPAATPRRTNRTVENPLVFSGLALSGANRHASAGSEQDDGILTAEEVAALDLEGVEWAVLSACDTGLGHVRAGEGVFGLRRAFQVAGVRTVVMSLWSVEDRAAGAWMRALYEARLRRRLDTADAVQAASRAVLADRRERHVSTNPFYWAGFVAVGDWR